MAEHFVKNVVQLSDEQRGLQMKAGLEIGLRYVTWTFNYVLVEDEMQRLGVRNQTLRMDDRISTL